jgi:hypothetical protein
MRTGMLFRRRHRATLWVHWMSVAVALKDDMHGAQNLDQAVASPTNRPEFISKELDLWAFMRGVTLDFSRRGKPTT